LGVPGIWGGVADRIGQGITRYLDTQRQAAVYEQLRNRIGQAESEAKTKADQNKQYSDAANWVTSGRDCRRAVK